MKVESVFHRWATLLSAVSIAIYPEIVQAIDSVEQALQLQAVLKETVARSEAVSQWALLVFGGSVAALLSSSYLQPRRRITRLMYLLFLPSWSLLMGSMYSGHQIDRVYIRALHIGNEPALKYQLDALWHLGDQSSALYWSLIPLALWLVLFLMWWIWSGTTDQSENRTPGPG